jgi:hypothetical protein
MAIPDAKAESRHMSVSLQGGFGRREKTASPSPTRWPLLIALALIGFCSAFVYFVRLTEPAPISPWEPAIAMEAVRFAHGMPVYESGHATHMYGPLLTVALAAVFSLTGINLLAARAVFSLAGIALSVLAAWLVCGKKLQAWRMPAAILFFGLMLRTYFIYATAQPDCIAFTLALAGLALWIGARHATVRRTAAVMLFICAMFFKQTSAAFALVPIVYTIWWERRDRFKTLALASIPTMALMTALLIVRLAWPSVFAGMITVPSSLHVIPARGLKIALYLLATFPLFFVGTMLLIGRRDRLRVRERWICAACAVFVAASIWTFAKTGGTYNSLLLAYLAMLSLFISQLDQLERTINGARLGKALAVAAIIAVAMIASFFADFDRTLPLLSARNGDEKRPVAIRLARSLGSGVASPEDPLIAWLANGYAGRSFYFELDAHPQAGEWPTQLPEGLAAELRGAKSIIRVRTYLHTDLLDRWLSENGFTPVPLEELRDSSYTLWRLNKPRS